MATDPIDDSDCDYSDCISDKIEDQMALHLDILISYIDRYFVQGETELWPEIVSAMKDAKDVLSEYRGEDMEEQ